MPVVKFYAGLRKAAGTNEAYVTAASLRVVLDGLVAQFPQLHHQVWDGKVLRSHIIITVNGQTLDLEQGLDSPVAPEDKIAIFPPIAGG